MRGNHLKLAYLQGILAARQKTATVAGPIAYAPRHTQAHTDYTANKRQDLWAEFDQEPKQTGEESSLGMPTAGGLNKAANAKSKPRRAQSQPSPQSRYLAQQKIKGMSFFEWLMQKKPSTKSAGLLALVSKQLQSDKNKRNKNKPAANPSVAKTKTADTGDTGYGFLGHGPYAQGGFDADQPKPDRFKRMSSAMHEAFRANEDYDQSYAPESAITQPHGSKYATAQRIATFREFQRIAHPMHLKFAAPGLSGITGGIPSSSTSMMSPLQAPQMPKLPKIPRVSDPRADKPPGMNLQHSVQTNMSTADSQAGFTSPQRRLMGSPI